MLSSTVEHILNLGIRRLLLCMHSNHELALKKLRNIMPDMTQPVHMWNPVSFNQMEITYIKELCSFSKHLTELIEKEEDERGLKGM